MTTTEASAQRALRARLYAARVDIDGRLVAVNARDHGTVSTRKNHGCECEPCMAAVRPGNVEANRRYRQRLRERSRSAASANEPPTTIPATDLEERSA